MDIERLSHILKIVFVVSLSLYFFSFNMERPRILILHSYNLDYGWTRELNEGIMRVLKNQTKYSLHWQYMDTKNHPNIGFKQKAGILVRRMISRLKPQVIIACDDDAQDFAAKFYVDAPDVKIVFCAVNGHLSDYGYDTAENVTGVLERVPLNAIQEAVTFMAPKETPVGDIKIINLGDTSGTVRRDEQHILSFNWSPMNLIDSILVDTFDEWKQAVKDATGRAHCLLITNYRQLRRSRDTSTFVPPQEVMQWTQKHANVPIIAGNGFIVEEGGTLAIAASPYEQGEKAARMALRILEGEPIYKIPVASTQNFLVYMRESFRDQKTNLPEIYDSFALGIGKMIRKNPSPAVKNTPQGVRSYS